jgi:ADP-ribosyl-[dinitrogen reductase] hydrolase
MILQAAIGDAYGAGFEFQDMDYIRQNNHLQTYFQHGLCPEIHKRYTDDTQMTLAIAELLLEQDDWNVEMVADKFVEVFHRDKRRGYSERVYNALDASKNGKDFIKIIDNKSGGNGSSMRAYPLGLIPDLDKMLHFAEIQAKTSHDTTEGITCAKRMALAIHYHRYGYDKQCTLTAFLNETLKEKEVYKVTSPIDMHGFPTTQAVMHIVSEQNSLKDCLKYSIDFGGDTDTVASLCLAILSQKKGVKHDLPDFLFDELENGAFGRDYLIGLYKKLNDKFSKI